MQFAPLTEGTGEKLEVAAKGQASHDIIEVPHCTRAESNDGLEDFMPACMAWFALEKYPSLILDRFWTRSSLSPLNL
jgi:hypothetical protein